MAAVMSGVLLAGCSSASADNASQTTAAQSEAAAAETSAEGETTAEAAADVDDELAQIQKGGIDCGAPSKSSSISALRHSLRVDVHSFASTTA